MGQINLLVSVVTALVGASAGVLLTRAWDIWTEKRKANAARHSVRDEQRTNLERLEKWLAAVERRDFPKSFPA
jgi:hypothetical protein